MLNEMTNAVSTALKSIMDALLALPRFQAEQYMTGLKEILSRLPADKPLAEALRDASVSLPAYPLVGEVRGRLEAALATDSTGKLSLSFGLPEPAIGFGYSRSDTTSSRSTLVVEIGARYNRQNDPFDFESLKTLKVSDVMDKLNAAVAALESSKA
ncbi:MAG: hypothetical protein WC712_02960 [Candidatus Brocadiia bacterium]